MMKVLPVLTEADFVTERLTAQLTGERSFSIV